MTDSQAYIFRKEELKLNPYFRATRGKKVSKSRAEGLNYHV